MHLIDLIAMGLLRRPAVADLLTQHAAKAVADRTAEDARLRWQAQNLDKLDPAANVAGNPYLAGQGIAAPSAVVTKLAPTTPSMTVDGVRYVEAQEGSDDPCDGCAGLRHGLCNELMSAAGRAFGGKCGPRGVIYVKATD